jgi:hypothetical protein
LGGKAKEWQDADTTKRLQMYGASIGNETMARLELNNK